MRSAAWRLASSMPASTGSSPARANSAGRVAKTTTGITDSDQIRHSTSRMVFARNLLASGAATSCASPKVRNMALATSPNCSGVMSSSSINGTAARPRTALSAQLSIMRNSSKKVSIQA